MQAASLHALRLSCLECTHTKVCPALQACLSSSQSVCCLPFAGANVTNTGSLASASLTGGGSATPAILSLQRITVLSTKGLSCVVTRSSWNSLGTCAHRITPAAAMVQLSEKIRDGSSQPFSTSSGAKAGQPANGKLHATVNGRLAMHPAHRNTQIRCLCDVNVDRGHMIQCEVSHPATCQYCQHLAIAAC